ncbi:hypothetical protein IRJ41_025047 [Triplophysa rosa]|uniref:Uncharacterized protein n=1 Tax=Triplophysa rosa TaxID=992332 RepID=A0A9W7T831_TRIRA|nr:hypothetical protein IRJ41_025047 [Triplophysa rosa]
MRNALRQEVGAEWLGEEKNPPMINRCVTACLLFVSADWIKRQRLLSVQIMACCRGLNSACPRTQGRPAEVNNLYRTDNLLHIKYLEHKRRYFKER